MKCLLAMHKKEKCAFEYQAFRTYDVIWNFNGFYEMSSSSRENIKTSGVRACFFVLFWVEFSLVYLAILLSGDS